MKALLVAEYRDGQLLGSYQELIDFGGQLGAECAMFAVGSKEALPAFNGTLYLADVSQVGEFDPDAHKQLLLGVIEQEQPDYIVFSHSSYGWDLAPRVAFSLKASQISEVVEISDGTMVVPVCNAKLRRQVKPSTPITVVTLQAGAFGLAEPPTGSPEVKEVAAAGCGSARSPVVTPARPALADVAACSLPVSAR